MLVLAVSLVDDTCSYFDVSVEFCIGKKEGCGLSKCCEWNEQWVQKEKTRHGILLYPHPGSDI